MLCTCYAATREQQTPSTTTSRAQRKAVQKRSTLYTCYAATRVASQIAVGLPAVPYRITTRPVSRYTTRTAILIARMAGRYLPHEGDCDPAPLGG